MRRIGYTRLGVMRKKPQPKPPDPASLPAMQQCMVRAVPWTSISEWLLELEEILERSANSAIAARLKYFKEYDASRSFGSRRYAPSSRYLKPVFDDPQAEDAKRLTPVERVSESGWAREARRLEQGYYVPNTHLARKDAAFQLGTAVQAFARRAAIKMIEHGCEDPTKVKGDLLYTGQHLIATVYFTAKDGRQFLLKCRTKTNYRYGENSANGQLTVYLQYPFKVTEGPFTTEQG